MNEYKRNEEKEPAAQIPYFLHEAEMFRWTKESQRMRVLVYIMLAATIVTNAAWALNYFGIF